MAVPLTPIMIVCPTRSSRDMTDIIASTPRSGVGVRVDVGSVEAEGDGTGGRVTEAVTPTSGKPVSSSLSAGTAGLGEVPSSAPAPIAAAKPIRITTTPTVMKATPGRPARRAGFVGRPGPPALPTYEERFGPRLFMAG